MSDKASSAIRALLRVRCEGFFCWTWAATEKRKQTVVNVFSTFLLTRKMLERKMLIIYFSVVRRKFKFPIGLSQPDRLIGLRPAKPTSTQNKCPQASFPCVDNKENCFLIEWLARSLFVITWVDVEGQEHRRRLQASDFILGKQT